MDDLRIALASVPAADTRAGDAVRARAADILRPRAALARLDELAAWVAEWQRRPDPFVRRPTALLFAADHGVSAAGVSAYPAEVTAAMVAAFAAQRSTVSAFADIAGCTVRVIDVGVGRPTGDLRTESALSPARFAECVAAGFDAVAALDADLLVLGEMGIGNTTAAACVAATLCGGDPARWVGAGTGIDDDGRTRKVAAVTAGVRRVAGLSGAAALDPLEVLREVGGAELVAIAAATVAARQRSIPVLLDGYVVTAAVLPLALVRPDALAHCRVGHCSAEPGHRRLLEHLGMQWLLDLDMRLGEASGAVAAIPLVRMACVGITDVPTFGEWFA